MTKAPCRRRNEKSRADGDRADFPPPPMDPGWFHYWWSANETRQIGVAVKPMEARMAENNRRAHTSALRWVGAFLLGCAGIAGASAQASAITCKGEYQVVQGQLLATPYCQDNYLAHVAREYGTRVPARQIRNNPNKKAEVCRFMGFDARVSHICEQYRNNSPAFGGR